MERAATLLGIKKAHEVCCNGGLIFFTVRSLEEPFDSNLECVVDPLEINSKGAVADDLELFRDA
jgi:hypothetical protein